MRKAFDCQRRFDCQPVFDVRLNLNCRDEIVPILRALQHIDSEPKPRDAILRDIAQDVNRTSSRRRGRNGMDYWQILVLAAVRLGCNLDYDGYSGGYSDSMKERPSWWYTRCSRCSAHQNHRQEDRQCCTLPSTSTASS